MFSPDLVDKGVIFAAAAAAGCCFCCSRCPFAVIPDSGRYLEISFSVSPGHVENDPSLIVWSRVRLVGQHRLWGFVAPLVYCGCISVAPECLIVCCSGLDDEEGIAIIHLLGPDSIYC